MLGVQHIVHAMSLLLSRSFLCAMFTCAVDSPPGCLQKPKRTMCGQIGQLWAKAYLQHIPMSYFIAITDARYFFCSLLCLNSEPQCFINIMTAPQTKKIVADASTSGEPLSKPQHVLMRVGPCYLDLVIFCDDSGAFAVLLP